MLITLLLHFTGTALLLNGSLGLQFPQNASSMAMLVSHTWTTILYFIPPKKTLQTCLVVGYCIYDDSVVIHNCSAESLLAIGKFSSF